MKNTARETNKKFYVIFHSDTDCMEASTYFDNQEDAKDWIEMYNGTDWSYFPDFPGGMVEVRDDDPYSDVVYYSTEIINK